MPAVFECDNSHDHETYEEAVACNDRPVQKAATKHEPRSKRSHSTGTCKHCGLYINASLMWEGWIHFGEDGSSDECPTN